MTSKRTLWCRRKRDSLLQSFGGICHSCGSPDNLEFAHKHGYDVLPLGRGRGSYERLKSISEHSEAFLLLCKKCHRFYDRNEMKVSEGVDKVFT